MAKKTKLSETGTSFHGVVIVTTANKLMSLFPKSYTLENDGRDKVNIDFVLETENGDVFTIYDWKEYRPIDLDEEIEFHIGAFSPEISDTAQKELLELLK